ncbi:DUF3284 domain-containing protein [Agrilactobacillus yilanensis]|uniref:DUF3284 domain-containing protein n=1 Tax=Agrilactobacillus yilanensis TaxID=2485997 RepID=A0ABW4J9S5_9LACO|nr:DUF3284 domain-containing protein [Agrilactobacillus yilanensis]
MELKQVLNIPTTFFYKMLIDPVLYDVQRYKGQSVRLDQLQGLQYIRKMSNNEDNIVTITKVVPDRSYHFTSEVEAVKTAVSYDLKPLNDQSFELTYSENIVTSGLFDRAKEKLKETFLDNMHKRNLRRIWNQIEESY